MTRGWRNLVLGAVSILFLAGCGKSKGLLTAAQSIRTDVLFASLSSESSRSLGNGAVEVEFLVQASGASGYRFRPNQMAHALEFVGQTTYKRTFASTNDGVISESGQLEYLDRAGKVLETRTLQSGPILVDSENPGVSFSCANVQVMPDPIRIYLGPSGNPIGDGIGQLKVDTSDDTILSQITPADNVSGLNYQVLSGMGRAHLADIRFASSGKKSLIFHFSNPNSANEATCAVSLTVLAVAAPATCSLAVTPDKVMVSADSLGVVQATLLPGNGSGPITDAYIGTYRLFPGQTTIPLALPKGEYVIQGWVAGPGGNTTCDSNVIEVVGILPTCTLTATSGFFNLPGSEVKLSLAHDNLAQSGSLTSSTIAGVAVGSGQSLSVRPKSTTTYVAKVSNSNGESTCSVTVKVGF